MGTNRGHRPVAIGHTVRGRRSGKPLERAAADNAPDRSPRTSATAGVFRGAFPRAAVFGVRRFPEQSDPRPISGNYATEGWRASDVVLSLPHTAVECALITANARPPRRGRNRQPTKRCSAGGLRRTLPASNQSLISPCETRFLLVKTTRRYDDVKGVATRRQSF